MELAADEPIGPLRVVPMALLAGAVQRAAGVDGANGTRVVAVDGRSASGKTTLSRRLAAAIPGTSVVHTDDIAWWHSIFGWTELLVSGVLEPVRRGDAVSYRPPAWDERGRTGSVDVPAGLRLLIVEGVGSGRRELAPLLDAIVYVHVDLEESQRRDELRVSAGETTAELVSTWMAEEIPFVAEQRPWERADLVVCSASGIPHDPEREAVVAESPLLAP